MWKNIPFFNSGSSVFFLESVYMLELEIFFFLFSSRGCFVVAFLILLFLLKITVGNKFLLTIFKHHCKNFVTDVVLLNYFKINP